MSFPVPKLKLNDGNEIPMVGFGFGTALLKAPDDEVKKSVMMAIENGFYHLDCAEMYETETGVREGIAASGVPRERLFITTKVVGTAGQDVGGALEASLARLGTDYVDLYLVHLPFAAGGPEGLREIWRQVEAAKEAGKARSIGVSNFMAEDIDILLEGGGGGGGGGDNGPCRYPPAINQVEFHPYLQHGDLLPYHRARGIALAAYSPLTALTAAAPGPVDAAHAEIAARHSGDGEVAGVEIEPADVALRWCVDQGVVAVTQTRDPERARRRAANLPRFRLEPAEVERISELGRQKHFRREGLAYMSERYGNYKPGRWAEL